VSLPQGVLCANEFAGRSSTTGGIQEAINALPAAGGVVYLPPGRYALRRSVELRSGVTIRGEGPSSVLVRPKEIWAAIAQPSDGTRKTVQLKQPPRGLKVGDEIHISDSASRGWWSSHCIVREIDGKTLGLEVLHGQKDKKFLPQRDAFLANWFPAFWLREVKDVTIESVTIEGTDRRLPRDRCDFVVAAVHTRDCRDVRVSRVTVRNWLGDGIGIQGGRGAQVSGCIVENCVGHGYHPGTGVTQSVWSDNIARGNTRDGFFFCLRVTHSTVRGNVLVGNRGHGIGGLTDPDAFNTVIGNVCAENGLHGIDADHAVGNTIQGNVCRGNSRCEPGKYAGIYLAGHKHCVVTGNVCVDDAVIPTQLQGLVNRDPLGRNTVKDNESWPE
jgi:parallel beta-helix repeat protein